ncbi:MAG: hypothetical protein RIQ69_2445, partial [Pseudomonadota bacterium]
MRLLTFTRNGSGPLIGIRIDEKILAINEAAKIAGESNLPTSMKDLL